MTALPTGRRGQMVALALLGVVAFVVWAGAVSPVLDWFADRATHLKEQQVLGARMQSVASLAPALQQRLAVNGTSATPTRAMFDGANDAVAGAALQQAVQDVAAHAGATIQSAEVLPASAVGTYRRLGLHVTVSGSWPVLVNLLAATLQSTPHMLVDDLQFRQTQALDAVDSHPMEATMTVVAFNARSPADR